MINKTLLIALLLIVMQGCTSNHHKKHGHHGQHHRFDDANKWAKIFEADKRVSWQKPQEVISAVGIKKNSLVADIGSATGFFPIRIARVASNGRVWGIDIEPNLIRFLNTRAQKENINNLFSILGTFDDPLIPEPVDFIFIVNTYHHISKRKTYFNNLKKSLRRNGKIVIIDFKKGNLPFGPKDHAKISRDQIIQEMNNTGFSLAKEHKILDYQNMLVFSLSS